MLLNRVCGEACSLNLMEVYTCLTVWSVTWQVVCYMACDMLQQVVCVCFSIENSLTLAIGSAGSAAWGDWSLREALCYY